MLAALVWCVCFLASGRSDEGFSVQTIGDKQVLSIRNPYLCVETVTIRATLENTSVAPLLPLTVEVPIGVTQALCHFTVADPLYPWHFHYIWRVHCGSRSARPDDSVVYTLPYPRGITRQIIQGFHGKFSHTGQYDHAIDWAMPVGSPVCAARDGLVVKIKADSDQGGPTRDFIDKANFISILHSDGTIGVYNHLQREGARVTVGQRVKAGDLIALSGNTGFSSQPHLHFHVCSPLDGEIVRTFPIKFRVSPTAAIYLVEGQSYTAQ
jgi:murein DD-endopeptidase MepM/ murein hydrolase activator NlpD